MSRERRQFLVIAITLILSFLCFFDSFDIEEAKKQGREIELRR